MDLTTQSTSASAMQARADLMMQLSDPNPEVRAIALEELKEVPASELIQHAPAMVKMLDSSSSAVRLAALEVMSLVPVDERSKHLVGVAERLERGDDAGVRHAALWALAKLPADERGQQAGAIRQKLEHESEAVRRGGGAAACARRRTTRSKSLPPYRAWLKLRSRAPRARPKASSPASMAGSKGANLSSSA